VISLLVTGKFGLAGTVASVEVLTKIALFHERACDHPLGKTNYSGAQPLPDSRKPAGEADFFGHVVASVNRFSELFGVPGAFGVYCHLYFPASP
jgi:hypothetical protein